MKSKTLLKILAPLLLLASCMALFLVAVNQPLAAHLDLSRPLASPTPFQPSAQANASPGDFIPQTIARLLSPSKQGQQGVCGKKGQMTLLVSGISRVKHQDEHGVGSIRLVGVDFDEGVVKILAMHPLIWVQTPALEKDGIDATELTKVYLYAREFAQGDESVLDFKATKKLAQTLADDFDFVPDRYVTVDPQVFADIVNNDLEGGLVIDVPYDLDATAEGYGTFEEGTQTMDGLEALNYFSILQPNNAPVPDEWARFQRQNQVARALMETILLPENWDAIPAMLKDLRKMITTDLSVSELNALNCMVEQVDDYAELLQVEPYMVSYDTAGHLIPDVEVIKEHIAELPGVEK
jgi:hypothetical protein